MPRTVRDTQLDVVLAAVAHPVRRRILEILRERPTHAGRIAREFNLARPSVAQHLRVLREAGLVTTHRRGQLRYSVLDKQPLGSVVGWLETFRRYESRRVKESWRRGDQFTEEMREIDVWQ